MSNLPPDPPPPPPAPPPGPAQPKPRPTVVTVSSLLLWLTALLFAANAVADLVNLGTYSDVFEQAYAEVEGGAGFAVATVVIADGVSLLFAIGFALLAIFNNLGRNGSRITTWVIGGLAVCCTGGFLALDALTSGLEVEEGPSPEEINDLLAEALPGWHGVLSQVGTFGSVAAVIVAMILLMLPKANEFFRKPTEADLFEPPEYPPPGSPPAPGPA